MSGDMDKQAKVAHKLVDVVNRAYTKTCVNFLRYSVDKQESSCAQIQFFARKKGDEKIQHTVCVKHKQFIYLLEVMYSAYDKIITNRPISNVLGK